MTAEKTDDVLYYEDATPIAAKVTGHGPGGEELLILFREDGTTGPASGTHSDVPTPGHWMWPGESAKA